MERIQAKSILSPLKGGPDKYFGIMYNMNLYRGCQHQCIYCDSRSKVYGIKDFSKIQVKANALQLLETSLRKKRKKGTIGTGSMNDPYMPVEKDEKIVRKALEIIARYKYPVHILTKSDLVLRDVDLIQKIKEIYAAVSITITTSDIDLSKKIEPGAPDSKKRFQLIKSLSEEGIYCGVVLTPVLPFITDSAENIKTIVHRSADCGAKYILGWMGMTQREGQREYFYQKLDQLFPQAKEKYIKRFGNNYNCNAENSENLFVMFREECLNRKLKMRMNHYTPDSPQQLSLFS